MTFTLSDLQRQSAQDFVKSRLDLQEELLQELKLLKQDLNSKLELEINQEYSSFISLPLNLIGSDEIILDFKSKLSDALLQLQSISEDYQGDSKLVKDLILKRQDIRKEKQKLKIQVQVSERLSKVVKLPSPDLSSMAQFEEYCKKLDRYSIEYSQLQFLCSQVAGNGSERLEILEMKANLSSAIQTCFRKCFQELLLQNRLVDGNQSEDGSVQARLVQNEGQIQTLQTCTEILVRISATLGTLNPTGEIFKQVIIDPFLAKLSLVQEHDLFPSVKDFLDSHCLIIDKVANSRSSFVVDGWQSICQYLLDNQPMIFHVSSPQRFHDLFQSSQKVIEYITENEANSLQLRAGTVYRDFCKRWQLSVYFQLINNEHVSNFEQCLSQDTVFESGEIDGFKLRQTVLLFKILKHIWGPNVFIRQLGHRFTKMTIIVLFIYPR